MQLDYVLVVHLPEDVQLSVLVLLVLQDVLHRELLFGAMLPNLIYPISYKIYFSKGATAYHLHHLVLVVELPCEFFL